MNRTVMFVAFDANRTALTDFLKASPAWTRAGISHAGIVHLWDTPADPHILTTERVAVPSAHPAIDAEEDLQMCAEAAHRINAHALGLPYNTTRAAVRRFVGIAKRTESDPALRDIYDLAVGRASTEPDDDADELSEECGQTYDHDIVDLGDGGWMCRRCGAEGSND